jgi:dolichol-phosphate mannosyltransferase
MTKIKENLSVLIPVYNEEQNIKELYSRLKKAQAVFQNPFETVFVNDGSTDATMEILRSLAASDGNLRVIDLSRNFGHQTAIKAGLNFVSGDAAVIMDADLQDPPELIESMVMKWREGYDVVYAVRKNRKEGMALRFLYFSFYRLLKAMSRVGIPLDSGDFCLLDKRIAAILAAMPEKNPFLRGLRSWVGYRQTGIGYERMGRHGGRTKYSLFKLVKLALDGILSFSDIPLRVSAIAGFFISLVSSLQIIALVIRRLPVPGTTFIAVLVLFLGGVQLISIGILGEYMGRIYEEVKNRPHFLIKETLNVQPGGRAA